MGCSVPNTACLLAALLLSTSRGWAADQSAAAREAVAAMQRGDFSSAERTLRGEIQQHPEDAWALSLLGVALDNQKRIPEAADFHSRAVEKAPRSAEILNNYGTHLWSAGEYEKAETVFGRALAAAPAYFLVLYNLGVMATFTGHYERAREALETALDQQPQNVDVLYRLAYVEEATRKWEAAVMRLATASKLDPRRADVQKLLAVTTTELGALDDAAAAWDRYLKLEPGDDIARRERGYTAVKMGKFEQGVPELEWFLARHPDDPVVHYELGQSERSIDLTKALTHLDKALALDPNYVAALSARGNLYLQQGKSEAAVKDLEIAVSRQPDDAANLDRLGQAYQSLDRTADAVRVLGKAVELAPDDSKMMLHYGRALADAGRTEESKAAMDRFRQLGPEQKKIVPAGLVEYLSLAPEERHAEYRARVEKAAIDHLEDAASQLEFLKVILADGNSEQVAGAARRIINLKPDAATLAGAGRALLEAHQFGLSMELLEKAAADPHGAAVRVDLAIATYRSKDAKAGLAVLDRVPEPEKSGTYYLARAQMLDAAGRSEDSVSALGKALDSAPKRADFYQQGTGLLVAKRRASDALRWINEAAEILPESREILLMKATTLEFAEHTDEAEHLLNEIQNRWPEWSAVWEAHGMILDHHSRFEEARQALETAVAVGARNSVTYFYLADATLRSGVDRRDAAEMAIGQALKLSPRDPWILTLAGRIAFERGEKSVAVERWRAAIRQRPQLIEAHSGLAEAFEALGKRQDAQAELQEVRSSAGAKDGPPYLARLFQQGRP